MSETRPKLPDMFYRVYQDNRIGEVIATRRIKRMYKGGKMAENPLGHLLLAFEDDAVFLADSIDKGFILCPDACGERAASKYWRGHSGIVRACLKYRPEQFEVIHHAPRFFAIAISPEWLDTSLLRPRYNESPSCKCWEWLYPDEIIAPVDLEPIEIEQAIAPYDALIEINSHV